MAFSSPSIGGISTYEANFERSILDRSLLQINVASIFGFNLRAVWTNRVPPLPAIHHWRRESQRQTVPESSSSSSSSLSRGRTRMGTVSRWSWSTYHAARLNVIRGWKDTLSRPSFLLRPLLPSFIFFRLIDLFQMQFSILQLIQSYTSNEYRI